MDYFKTNTATTHDWLKSSEGITLVSYGPVLPLTGFFEGTEEVAPETAVQLPEDVAKKLFSRTLPGLPVAGHEI
jgi:hypothetical protein